MTYPNAYCVKCGTHTETEQKHTVMLQSSARAVKGVCPKCASNVFKIVPKAKDFSEPSEAAQVAKKAYADAFCVKCQKHTETLNQKTIVLENASRAMTGQCKDCGKDVYRIMSPSQKAALRAIKNEATVKAAPTVPTARQAPAARVGKVVDRRAAPDLQARRAMPARHAETTHGQWTYVAAGGAIISIIVGFFVYAVMG